MSIPSCMFYEAACYLGNSIEACVKLHLVLLVSNFAELHLMLSLFATRWPLARRQRRR